MKRDMDLIRASLLEMVNYPEYYGPTKILFDGYEEKEVMHHLELLVEAGFIEADSFTVPSDPYPDLTPTRITWAGYEFIDAAKNDNIWAKFKNKLGEKGLEVPISVAQVLLISLLKDQFGI